MRVALNQPCGVPGKTTGRAERPALADCPPRGGAPAG